VFVVIEHHSRRLIHCNVTAHPSAAWTLQQLREAVGFEERYEYLLHDRDSIFAKHLDESIERLGVKVLKSPPRSPIANSVGERVIGTLSERRFIDQRHHDPATVIVIEGRLHNYDERDAVAVSSRIAMDVELSHQRVE
jgi:hypothetical protein